MIGGGNGRMPTVILPLPPTLSLLFQTVRFVSPILFVPLGGGILGTYEAEYERTGVLPENMIPSDENNFYFCWIVGAIIMTYLTVVMIISYAMKLYADSKQLNHPNSD